MKTPLPDDYDAFRQPREIRPGCQHMLGCRCTPPFWLREPTADKVGLHTRIVTKVMEAAYKLDKAACDKERICLPSVL